MSTRLRVSQYKGANNLRGWQTFGRAYRLSQGHAPRGLVHTAGTVGGYVNFNEFTLGLWETLQNRIAKGVWLNSIRDAAFGANII